MPIHTVQPPRKRSTEIPIPARNWSTYTQRAASKAYKTLARLPQRFKDIPKELRADPKLLVNAALTALNTGNIALAEMYLEYLATYRNPYRAFAMNHLAVILERRGEIAKATAWYTKAARLNNAEAMYNIGFLLLAGTPSDDNIQPAFNYLSNASKTFNQDAELMLQISMLAEHLAENVYRDNHMMWIIYRDEQGRALQKAAELGNSEAILKIARLREGLATPESYAEVERLYMIGIRRGDKAAFKCFIDFLQQKHDARDTPVHVKAILDQKITSVLNIGAEYHITSAMDMLAKRAFDARQLRSYIQWSIKSALLDSPTGIKNLLKAINKHSELFKEIANEVRLPEKQRSSFFWVKKLAKFGDESAIEKYEGMLTQKLSELEIKLADLQNELQKHQDQSNTDSEEAKRVEADKNATQIKIRKIILELAALGNDDSINAVNSSIQTILGSTDQENRIYANFTDVIKCEFSTFIPYDPVAIRDGKLHNRKELNDWFKSPIRSRNPAENFQLEDIRPVKVIRDLLKHIYVEEQPIVTFPGFINGQTGEPYKNPALDTHGNLIELPQYDTESHYRMHAIRQLIDALYQQVQPAPTPEGARAAPRRRSF